MVLQVNFGTYLQGKEAAARLGLEYTTFRNYRADKGDLFLPANTDLVPGRTFFRVEDVDRLAAERRR